MVILNDAQQPSGLIELPDRNRGGVVFVRPADGSEFRIMTGDETVEVQ